MNSPSISPAESVDPKSSIELLEIAAPGGAPTPGEHATSAGNSASTMPTRDERQKISAGCKTTNNANATDPKPGDDVFEHMDLSLSPSSSDGGVNEGTQQATPLVERDYPGIGQTSYGPFVSEEVPFSLDNSGDLETRGDIIIPDGGIRAWLVVLGGFINYATAFGVMNSIGTFQAHYSQKWPGLSTSTITWIGSIQLFVLFVGGLLVGPAFDRFGARPLMLAGTLFCTISWISNSFGNDFYQFLLSQGFLFGIGNSLLYYPAASSIAEWFDRKRGLALGIAVSGSSAGAIVWPLVLDSLLSRFGDIWVNRIMCIVSLPPLALSCYLVVERKGNAGRDTHGHATEHIGKWKTLTEGRFIRLSMALCLIYCGMLIPFYYIPTYAEDNGYEGSTGNIILSITYSGSFVGRIAAGAIANRLGRFNVLVTISTLTGAITLCWIAMKDYTTQVTFATLFGLFSGGIIPLGSACVAQTTTNMGHIGLRIGGAMTICSLGALVGGPISGALQGTAGSWPSVFAFSAVMCLAGAGLLLTARRRFEPRWSVVY